MRRPVIGIPADYRAAGDVASYEANESYVRAVVEMVGGIPLLIPAAGTIDGIDELLRRLDGILLTGHASNVEPHWYDGPPGAPGTRYDPRRDATALQLITQGAANGVPMLGICRGLQEMNVAFGGTLTANLHEVPGNLDHQGDVSLPLSQRFEPAHEVTLEARGLLRALAAADRIRVNSLHAQGVDRLGERLHVEARAPDGVIEAFSLEGARCSVAVQWHPEWRAGENGFSQALFTAFGSAARERARLGSESKRSDP